MTTDRRIEEVTNRWQRRGRNFTWLFAMAGGWCAVLLVSVSTAQEIPVTDGLLLWLDATDATTMFQDSTFTTLAGPGDPVGGWLDKSGNDFSATQPDVGLVPVRNDTAMNGYPALRFSGVESDGMLIDDGLSLARPYTAFIVNQYYGDVRGRTLQGRDANWLHGLWGGNISSYADGFIGANPMAESNVVYVADTTGTPTGDSTFVVNSVNLATNPAPLGAPGRLGLMSGGQFPLEVSDADVSEIVIYNRVLTEAELSDVRNYLYTKYDVNIPVASNTVLAGSLGTFTGGDPGEGLDLEGSFAYAINLGGPGALVVGDATFTDGSLAGMQGGSTPGATIVETNEAIPWTYVGEYGDTTNDNNLEVVMQSIRWSDSRTQPPLGVDLAVEEGLPYRLQLLFAEGIWDRGFNISVEGETVVEAFNIHSVQGGYWPENADRAVVYTLDLVAQDDTLSIALGGWDLRSADNNPLLQGLTLELVPEPGSLTLILLGLGGLLAVRGRRRSK